MSCAAPLSCQSIRGDGQDQPAGLPFQPSSGMLNDSALALAMQEEEYASTSGCKAICEGANLPLQQQSGAQVPEKADATHAAPLSRPGIDDDSSQGLLQPFQDGHGAASRPQLQSGTSSLAAGLMPHSSRSAANVPGSEPAYGANAGDIPVNLAAIYCKPASPLLDVWLGSLGLYRSPTLANGGCFLSALAFTARRSSLTDDQDVTRFPTMQELHLWGRELRNSIIGYIRQWAVLNPDAATSCFSHIVQDPAYENLSGFDDWVKGQEGSCSYTDEVFMDFAAEYLGCPILSMWSSSGRWRVYPRDGMLRRELAPILLVFIEALHGGLGHFEVLTTSTTSFAEAHSTAGLDLFDNHAQLADSHAAPSATQQAQGHASFQGGQHSRPIADPEDKATAGLTTQATTAADLAQALTGTAQAMYASTGSPDQQRLGQPSCSHVQSLPANQQDMPASGEELAGGVLAGGHSANIPSRKGPQTATDVQPSPAPKRRMGAPAGPVIELSDSYEEGATEQQLPGPQPAADSQHIHLISQDVDPERPQERAKRFRRRKSLDSEDECDEGPSRRDVADPADNVSTSSSSCEDSASEDGKCAAEEKSASPAPTCNRPREMRRPPVKDQQMPPDAETGGPSRQLSDPRQDVRSAGFACPDDLPEPEAWRRQDRLAGKMPKGTATEPLTAGPFCAGAPGAKRAPCKSRSQEPVALQPGRKGHPRQLTLLPQLKPEPLNDQDNDQPCSVCHERLGDYQNEMIFCDGAGCDVVVHQNCYGVESIPIGDWLCAGCQARLDPKGSHCLLCPGPNGALCKVSHFGSWRPHGTKPGAPPAECWVHNCCVLWTPEVTMAKPTFQTADLRGLTCERLDLACCHCTQQGAVIQCSFKACQSVQHVSCARQAGCLTWLADHTAQPLIFCRQHSEDRFEQERDQIVKAASHAAGPEGVAAAHGSHTAADMSPPEGPMQQAAGPPAVIAPASPSHCMPAHQQEPPDAAAAAAPDAPASAAAECPERQPHEISPDVRTDNVDCPDIIPDSEEEQADPGSSSAAHSVEGMGHDMHDGAMPSVQPLQGTPDADAAPRSFRDRLELWAHLSPAGATVLDDLVYRLRHQDFRRPYPPHELSALLPLFALMTRHNIMEHVQCFQRQLDQPARVSWAMFYEARRASRSCYGRDFDWPSDESVVEVMQTLGWILF